MSDNDKKKNKLDSLLLFSASTTGIILTLFTGLFGGIVDYSYIFFLIPLLILQWIMPIYVGYWRGALELDCIEERIRGWIYLLAGVASYAGFIVSFSLIGLIDNIFIRIPLEFLALFGILSTAVAFIAPWISKEILIKVKKPLTEEFRNVVWETGWWASIFAFLLLSFATIFFEVGYEIEAGLNFGFVARLIVLVMLPIILYRIGKGERNIQNEVEKLGKEGTYN